MWVEGLSGGGGGGGKIITNVLPTSGTASTYGPDSRFTVDKSYDGSRSTAWMFTSGSAYAIYDLGSSTYVMGTDIIWATGSATDTSITVQILGSNDNSSFSDSVVPTTESFVVNNTWNNQSVSTSKQTTRFKFNAEYRYYKVTITKSSGANVGIGDIYFWEEVDF